MSFTWTCAACGQVHDYRPHLEVRHTETGIYIRACGRIEHMTAEEREKVLADDHARQVRERVNPHGSNGEGDWR